LKYRETSRIEIDRIRNDWALRIIVIKMYICYTSYEGNFTTIYIIYLAISLNFSTICKRILLSPPMISCHKVRFITRCKKLVSDNGTQNDVSLSHVRTHDTTPKSILYTRILRAWKDNDRGRIRPFYGLR
jgi:hypothetical protein